MCDNVQSAILTKPTSLECQNSNYIGFESLPSLGAYLWGLLE